MPKHPPAARRRVLWRYFTGGAFTALDMTFCASYDSPTQLVRRAILEAVEDDSRILHDPAPFVAIKSYEASSVQYLCWVWTEVKDYWDVYYSLNESVRDSFAERGVVMPYSQLDVHMNVTV